MERPGLWLWVMAKMPFGVDGVTRCFQQRWTISRERSCYIRQAFSPRFEKCNPHPPQTLVRSNAQESSLRRTWWISLSFGFDLLLAVWSFPAVLEQIYFFLPYETWKHTNCPYSPHPLALDTLPHKSPVTASDGFNLQFFSWKTRRKKERRAKWSMILPSHLFFFSPTPQLHVQDLKVPWRRSLNSYTVLGPCYKYLCSIWCMNLYNV